MSWESFYLVCFFAGLLLAAIAFLAGALHLAHLHAHHAGSPAGHGATVSKFNFATLASFLAWFGGAGYLMERYSVVWGLLALALATLTGLAGASVVFWFLAKVVLVQERVLDPADYDIMGALGRVSSAVRPGGTGEMVFSQAGARKALSIRSDDGSSIPKDAEVVVTRYEKGIAYVRRWEDLAGPEL
ncbi:MAG: hypothetical protein ACRD9L_27740 [Bryobacteraceae bacterium]